MYPHLESMFSPNNLRAIEVQIPDLLGVRHGTLLQSGYLLAATFSSQPNLPLFRPRVLQLFTRLFGIHVRKEPKVQGNTSLKILGDTGRNRQIRHHFRIPTMEKHTSPKNHQQRCKKANWLGRRQKTRICSPKQRSDSSKATIAQRY